MPLTCNVADTVKARPTKPQIRAKWCVSEGDSQLTYMATLVVATEFALGE